MFAVGFGREGATRPLPSAEPRAARERVEYRRGPVTEWYVNRPDGLEQGFEIAASPAGGNEPLVLALAVEGDLRAALDRDAAVFSDRSGQTVVRYEGLRAWDADGRTLPARMEADGHELRLVVQAQAARFPVTVDPTFRREGRLEAPDVANFLFGASIALAGDTAVVCDLLLNDGSGWQRGSAYVFARSGSTWTEPEKLIPLDGPPLDFFGESVAVSGDTVVVGARTGLPGLSTGSAYVFHRSGTAWTQQQRLTVGMADDFGGPVAIDGDTILVGAVHEGAVYVFVRSGATWTLQQRLSASDGAAGFGGAVALHGDTAVVGAPYDSTGGANVGSAYAFVRTGYTWAEQQKLTASNGAEGNFFGAPVALSGETAVVGDPWDDNAGGTDAGTAYVFVRSGAVWTREQQLLATDGVPGDRFGGSVAISGDTILAGKSRNGAPVGSAYVFVRSGAAWNQRQKLSAWNYGELVALSGDTAVVTAPGVDLTPDYLVRSAYAFRPFTKGDVDRDDQTDLLLRQGATGHNDAWLMDGITRPGAPVAISPDPDSPDWVVAATDDFNGDRSNDLLFWNGATGAAEFWLMSGATRTAPPIPLDDALPPPWKPAASADFNNDGQPDLVYRNSATQKIAIWTLDGVKHDGTLVPSPDQAAASNWGIVGAQDWNADGATDFLWYNLTSGKLVLWFMDASVVRIAGQFTNPQNAGDNNWKALAMGDYGVGPGGLPGTNDVVWRNATSGRFVVWYMDQAGNRTAGVFTSPDSPSPNPTDWTIAGPR